MEECGCGALGCRHLLSSHIIERAVKLARFNEITQFRVELNSAKGLNATQIKSLGKLPANIRLLDRLYHRSRLIIVSVTT